MVGGSELAFRLLARRHGAQLCYTPMMHAHEFIAPRKTDRGIGPLEVHADDAPLVAHFSGNDPATVLAAARRAERCAGVVAIDLNLGCPQRSAHSGYFGAFLCVDEAGRALVLRMVQTLSRGLRLPVFCKIRLLDEGEEATIAFARQLEAAGCALLAVHGRYRGSPMHRRDGPAHLEQVRAIKASLSIPVLTNGNVRDAGELLDSLALTGADGVMSAEAALDDPAIFARAIETAAARRRKLKKAVKRGKAAAASGEETDALDGVAAAREQLRALPRFEADPPPAARADSADDSAGRAPPAPAYGREPLDLAEQYLDLLSAHPADTVPLPSCREPPYVFHVRRLCRKLLASFELTDRLTRCASVHEARHVVARCREYAEGARPFVQGAEAAEASEADRTARRAANAARRAEFVARMHAKAQKAGKPDDFYLRDGLAPPTPAQVAEARRMGRDERLRFWRQRFGQHCQGHYLEDKCPHLGDARGCGFLHGDEDAT